MLQTLGTLSAIMFLGIGLSGAQISQPATSPAPRSATTSDIDAIWAYAGTWKIDTEDFATPYSKAGHKVTTLHNECWRSGPYIACRQIVDGDSKVLIVFTCTRPDHYCISYQIPPDGSNPGSGTMHIEGNTWTFPWQNVDAGKTTYFRVVNVWSTPTTIDYRQEFSTDQVHWTPTATGHEVKTNPN